MTNPDQRRQTIGLTGDWLFTRRLSVFEEPEYLEMRDRLAATDAVFANLECAVHPYLDEPLAQRYGGGSYMTTPPALLPDMKWMGVNLVACGSSHADEYGPGSIMETKRHLENAGIVHAGSGRHMGEARMPGFLDTASGRIALVAMNAQYRNGAQAGEQRYDNAGYPGVNGFRHKKFHHVDAETFDRLREIGQKIGSEQEETRRAYQGDPDSDLAAEAAFDFLGTTFVRDDKFAITSTPHKGDMEANLAQVRHARDSADRVIVSFHCHHQGGEGLLAAKRRSEIEDIADFVVTFGRAAIDAGADIFVAHGPQVPGAIEIYKNRPLFYGLGSFVFQIETVQVLPAEAYERYDLGDRATPSDFIRARYADGTRGHVGDPNQWRQVYAICDFEGDAFVEARLYPVDLGQQRRRTDRGRPVPASPEVGRTILARIAKWSAKYGTDLRLEGNVGVVRP